MAFTTILPEDREAEILNIHLSNSESELDREIQEAGREIDYQQITGVGDEEGEVQPFDKHLLQIGELKQDFQYRNKYQ